MASAAGLEVIVLAPPRKYGPTTKTVFPHKIMNWAFTKNTRQSADCGTVWLRKTDSPQRLAATNQLDFPRIESSIFLISVVGADIQGLAVRPMIRYDHNPTISRWLSTLSKRKIIGAAPEKTDSPISGVYYVLLHKTMLLPDWRTCKPHCNFSGACTYVWSALQFFPVIMVATFRGKIHLMWSIFRYNGNPRMPLRVPTQPTQKVILWNQHENLLQKPQRPKPHPVSIVTNHNNTSRWFSSFGMHGSLTRRRETVWHLSTCNRHHFGGNVSLRCLWMVPWSTSMP